MYAHERITLAAVANTIAQVKHHEFAGYYDNAHNYSGNVFFVPDDTLMLDEALYLGIRSPNDLFGGVVPHPFVKTKSITHRLIASGADRPEGWSPAFPQRVRKVVLPGQRPRCPHCGGTYAKPWCDPRKTTTWGWR
jgi:Protein of unknown function (DUF3182)